MPRVLLLMPTSSYHAADFVEAADKLGVDVTVGTDETQAFQSRVPGSSITLDLDDLDGSVAAIERMSEDFHFDAVVATEDETTPLAAAAAAALGLPHNPPAAVLSTRSKLSLRRTLAAGNLPSPAFRVLDLGAGFAGEPRPERATRIKAVTAAALERGDVPFPCVLKPTFLAASRGVIRADDEVEFRAAAARIGEILHDEQRAGGGHRESHLILVEEYLPGEEYAVEAMLRAGQMHPLALFDKPDPLEGPYFEETIYVTPSRVGRDRREQILATTRRAIAALGLREGPVHAELRVSDRGAFIIDLAAREIGGLCPRVLRFGADASLEELILRHATGDDFTSFERDPEAGGVMMIPIPCAGTFRGVQGTRVARGIAGVREINFTLNPGQRVLPLPEGNRYLGFIFAHAETPAQVEIALRAAHAALQIDIEPA